MRMDLIDVFKFQTFLNINQYKDEEWELKPTWLVGTNEKST